MKLNLTTLSISVCLVIAYSSSIAQNKDNHPYKDFGGEEVQMLTLSNGKYNEFFDNDTIEIIGSAILNTNTMKVIGYFEFDTLYSEATLEPEVVSRWLSLDPLAAKYPYLSPYNFVGNNPISFIDPDGREIKPASNTSSRVLSNTLATFTKNGTGKEVKKLFGLKERTAKFNVGSLDNEKIIDQQVFGIEDNFTPKKFEKRLGKLVKNGTITDEQAGNARALFNVLKSEDIVELAVITNGNSNVTDQSNVASGQTSVLVGDNIAMNKALRSQDPQTVANAVNNSSAVKGKAGNGIFGFFEERGVGTQNINLVGTLLIDARSAGSGTSSQNNESPEVTKSVGEGVKNFVEGGN